MRGLVVNRSVMVKFFFDEVTEVMVRTHELKAYNTLLTHSVGGPLATRFKGGNLYINYI